MHFLTHNCISASMWWVNVSCLKTGATLWGFIRLCPASSLLSLVTCSCSSAVHTLLWSQKLWFIGAGVRCYFRIRGEPLVYNEKYGCLWNMIRGADDASTTGAHSTFNTGCCWKRSEQLMPHGMSSGTPSLAAISYGKFFWTNTFLGGRHLFKTVSSCFLPRNALNWKNC
jgi:hypothetical protein